MTELDTSPSNSLEEWARRGLSVSCCAALVFLFSMWALFVVVLNPAGTRLNEGSPLAYWPYVWSGLFVALPCLLAVWVALGSQAVTLRLAAAAVIAALFGLLAGWGLPPDRRGFDFLLLSLAIAFLDSLMLSLLRRRFGWKIGIHEHDSALSRHPAQFSIFNLLLWTAAIALLLLLASRTVPEWAQLAGSPQPSKWLGACLGVLVLSVSTLPLVIPATGVVLADGRRRRFAFWLSVVVALFLFPSAALMFFAVLNSGPRATVLEAVTASLVPAFFVLGFIGSMIGSLSVMRLCGARMN